MNYLTSLSLDPAWMENHNKHLQAKYEKIRQCEVRYETQDIDDAEYLIIAFGSAARIAQKSIELCRAEGIRIGMLRPITLWPFPTQAIQQLSERVKGIMCMEINAGQMVDDVRLSVMGRCPVCHYGRMGGMVPTPEEIVQEIKTQLIE